MARAVGLLNPKNAVESSGGSQFKEGNVRVDESCFKVTPPRTDKEGKVVSNNGVPDQPKLVLAWKVTRLDEELEPMVDEHDNPLTEELHFSLGGKALAKAHPGEASSADDEDVEDLGSDPNTEGNTVFVADETFKINTKSAIAILMKSLETAGWKPELLDRVWAPDYKAAIFWMKNQVSDDKIERTDKDGKKTEQAITYKVVGKIVKAPYEGKGKKGAAAETESAGGKKSGGNAEAEKVAISTLQKISEAMAGEDPVTRKALVTKVQMALQKAKVDAKLHVPVLSLVKDDKWLTKHAEQFDATLSTNDDGAITSVQFGPASSGE